MADTVLLIHGAWLTPSAWDRFRQRYEAAGMTVAAPPWPCLDGSVEAIRASTDPRLAKLGLREIVDRYAVLIRAMPEPPILIGHGFGGLVVQLLLDRGLGAVGVAIDPAPPYGVPATALAIWSALPVVTAWNGWNRALRMRLRAFSTGFAQTLPEAEKPYAWEKFVVPAPGRIFFQALLGTGSRVHWTNPARAPLLLIAGEKDRIAPAGMVRSNFAKQRRAPSLTEFREFPGRSHWLCNESGWEEVADTALDWARTHGRR